MAKTMKSLIPSRSKATTSQRSLHLPLPSSHHYDRSINLHSYLYSRYSRHIWKTLPVCKKELHHHHHCYHHTAAATATTCTRTSFSTSTRIIPTLHLPPSLHRSLPQLRKPAFHHPHLHLNRQHFIHTHTRHYQRQQHSQVQHSCATTSSSFHAIADNHQLSPTERYNTIHTLPQQYIRSFSIIAHIDHGKSTLSDRLLEYSGNIVLNVDQKHHTQILDNLQVEQERGITVRAQTSVLWYTDTRSENNQIYQLQLIDTPGHVDFSYEVSRSLRACNGVLLLIDSSQGIQAQTLANYYSAVNAGIKHIIPILTKIDLPHADVEGCKDQLHSALNMSPDDVLCVSNKTGENIEQIFPAIIDRIPPPQGDRVGIMRALLFDAQYNIHRGVICLVHIVDGWLEKGDKIAMLNTENSTSSTTEYEVQECGVLTPTPFECERLRAGQVGYIICGIKSTNDIHLGSTFIKTNHKKGNKPYIEDVHAFMKQYNIDASQMNKYLSVGAADVAYGIASYNTRHLIKPLPGFQQSKPMVYAGIYPSAASSFDSLTIAMNKLLLNDSSVHMERENSSALGMGYRCGFLGILHLDVFTTRLGQEFNEHVIITAPTVPCHAVMKNNDVIVIDSPAKFHALSQQQNNIAQYQEPTVIASVITPSEYMGVLMELFMSHRGIEVECQPLSTTRMLLKYIIPLSEILSEFVSDIKSLSSGYASMDYEPHDYMDVDLCCVDIRINHEIVDGLSILCDRSKSLSYGKSYVEKMSQVIDRQSFEISIQASIGNKIICSERVKAFRKDVLTKGGKTVGGGDVSRKRKLLEKQKEGKKRMKAVGNVELNQEVFASVMKIR